MKHFAILTVAALAMATPAFAQSVSTSIDETSGFLGLNLTFGPDGAGYEGVLGVVKVKTKADGDREGVKGSVHFGLGDGLRFNKVKLSGLTGDDNVMGELGLGYGPAGLIASGGLWGDYWNAGVDYGFGTGWGGYAGVHSFKPDGAADAGLIVSPPGSD